MKYIQKRNPVWDAINQGISDVGDSFLQKKLRDQQKNDQIKQAILEGVLSNKIKPKEGVDVSQLNLNGDYGSVLGQIQSNFSPTRAPTEFQSNLETIESMRRNNSGGVLGDNTGMALPSNDKVIGGMMSKVLGIPYDETLSPKDRERRLIETSPALQKLKEQRTEDFINLSEENKLKKQQIAEAIDAAKNVKGGFTGKVSRQWARLVNPDDPALGDFQKVKDVLTDATLAKTAHTKGAISDREMELFAQATANTDLASSPAMQVVFKKLIDFKDMQQEAKAKAYERIYGEDPRKWTDEGGTGKFTGRMASTNQPQSFSSEEDVGAANLPKGSIVLINGRRARVD